MSVNPNEDVYLNFLRDILDTGVPSDDRTGVGTIRAFGRQARYDLSAGFPLFTTKKIMFESVLSELLWFIEGSSDERRLAEIRYGRDADELDGKNTIWTENANAPYWVDKARFPGDLGRIYGVQYRHWNRPEINTQTGQQQDPEVDQLKLLIEGIKRDPNGRRHILSAWNPGELEQMALPPCHILAQFSVIDGKLSCLMLQR